MNDTHDLPHTGRQAQRGPRGPFPARRLPQPWWQTAGLVHVVDMARARTADALKTLADGMQDPTSPASARIAAAAAILDRAWGKPAAAVGLALGTRAGTPENLDLSALSDAQLNALIAGLRENGHGADDDEA